MHQPENSCCEWRKLVERALEKGDQLIIEEAIWNWVRFSEKTKDNSRFSCQFCQEKAIEWGKVCGFDLTNKNATLEKVQKQIKSGVIKCCEIIPLIDLEDPEKFILYEQALGFKYHFQEKLCFKCSVKVEGILATVDSIKKVV